MPSVMKIGNSRVHLPDTLRLSYTEENRRVRESPRIKEPERTAREALKRVAKIQKLPRRRRYTWSPSQWFQTLVTPVGSGLYGTCCICVGCPDDFYAVRLGFANISNSPYEIPVIKACPSSAWNDYVNPTGGANWVPLTFVNAGKDVDGVVTATGAPKTIVVAGNTADIATGGTSSPAWTFTDWVNINNVSPDAETAMRVLMIRFLVTNGATYTYAAGRLSGWTGNRPLNNGYDYFIGGYKFGADQVTDPTIMDKSAAETNSPFDGTPCAMVQFITAHDGLVGMSAGDSMAQGTSTSTQFSNYLAQLVIDLGKTNVGSVPMGWTNCAVGGLASEQIFARLQTIIKIVRPSFVILPTWTYNELNGSINADRIACNLYLARLFQTVDIVRAAGAVPILISPCPRDGKTMGSEQVAAWKAVYDLMTTMAPDEIVIDISTVLTDGQLAGVFPNDSIYTTDGVHPNDAGHALIASYIRPLLQAMLEDRSA
jgi:hypothetical protein